MPMEPSSPPDTLLKDQVQPNERGPPQQNYFGWLRSTFSQSTEVWDQIKQDITEVAQAVASSDPIAAAKGTASSVYRQFSDAVHNLQQGAKSDPPPPETETARDTARGGDFNLESPMSSVKSSFYEIVDALEKGLNELTGASFSFGLKTNTAGGGGGSDGNRDARIDVIRADPATFESSPSPQKDILPYEEWRKAYFNDQTCSPNQDMPIFEGLSLPSGSTPLATYPSPSRVLEESPIVRSHLLRLIDPDGGSGSLSETDFWSRYYYRVWCLDVLQLQRTRLVNKLEKEHADTAADGASIEAWPELVDDNDDVDGNEPKSDQDEVFKAATTSSCSATPPCDSQPAENINAGYFSPASSIVIVNKEEVTGDEEETDRHKLEPAAEITSGDEWREDVIDADDDEEDEDDRVQVTTECLKEAKLRSDRDSSDSGSEWEKWT